MTAKLFSKHRSGLSPENYSVLLVPVPAFFRKRTPSLAAFPKPVKDFQSTSSKKRRAPFFRGLGARGSQLDPQGRLYRGLFVPFGGVAPKH